MNSYIDKSDALDILDQFEDAVENGEGGFFYSKAREMMCNLPSEEIIHCKGCINFCNNHLCLLDKHGAIEVKPDDFCSYGEKAEIFNTESKFV